MFAWRAPQFAGDLFSLFHLDCPGCGTRQDIWSGTRIEDCGHCGHRFVVETVHLDRKSWMRLVPMAPWRGEALSEGTLAIIRLEIRGRWGARDRVEERLVRLSLPAPSNWSILAFERTAPPEGEWGPRWGG